MDPDLPRADAFSVQGNRFHLIGDEAFVMNHAGLDPLIIDLKHQVVLPGFIETHNHLSYYALTRLMVDCSSFSNKGISDIREKIAAAVSSTKKKQLIMGFGYDDTMMTENRHLTRQDLDDLAPDNPVFITHASGHLAYANSTALALGKVTRDTPQPAGGEIHMNEKGKPSGLLLEPAAMSLVAGKFPKPDTDLFMEALPLAMADYNKTGVTSTHDAGIGIMGQGPGSMEAYNRLEREGNLTVRVYLTMLFDYYDPFIEGGLKNGFGSDHLKFGSVKLFQDGSIQGLTGALKEDYIETPGFKGELIMPQAQLDKLVERYQKLGLQIAIHANGDAAIESVITSLERAREKYPHDDLRHMIIHCQMASEDHIQRMKKLDAIPSYFINHVYYWGDRHEKRFIGPDRASRIDPLGSSLRAGLRFTLHGDTPVTPISPLDCIHHAVNRVTREGKVLGENQRISPLDAVKTFTTDAAFCSFEENLKGSVTPGKLADFVVLSADPMSVPRETIRDIQVLQTVVGGNTVYMK